MPFIKNIEVKLGMKNVSDESFEAGNITEAGCSKASYKTKKSEQVSKSYPDKDLVQSISKLKEKYKSEMGSTVKGFIQYLSVEPFTIGLWMQKDIELYHEVGNFSHYCVMPLEKYVQTLMVNLSAIIRMSHMSMN